MIRAYAVLRNEDTGEEQETLEAEFETTDVDQLGFVLRQAFPGHAGTVLDWYTNETDSRELRLLLRSGRVQCWYRYGTPLR